MSEFRHTPKLQQALVKAVSMDNDTGLEGLFAEIRQPNPEPKSEDNMQDNLFDELEKELDFPQSGSSSLQFEYEYIEQLEQEILNITNDRDRYIAEATSKLEQEYAQKLAIAIANYDQEMATKSELINQLQCQNTALEISQQTLTSELEATQALLKESTKTIAIADTKLSEIKAQRDQFEEELISHLSDQAKLHQSLRGLENEYVTDLTRVQELEQQIEELQNQVLYQAAKAAEYEAAIQHWKEQSVRHQHHALQLRGALDRLLEERPVRHLTPLVMDTPSSVGREAIDVSPPEPVSVNHRRSPHPNAKVDLPSFLVHRRGA